MDINMRMATIDDIDKLVKARFDYLEDDKVEMTFEQRLIIEVNLQQYFSSHLGTNDFFAVLVEHDDQIISLAFLAISEKPPNEFFPTGKVGTLLNVFTYPEYRKKGLATNMINTLIKEAKQQNLSYIELSSSESGKPLYKKFGFEELKPSKYTEMKLSLLNSSD